MDTMKVKVPSIRQEMVLRELTRVERMGVTEGGRGLDG